MKMLLDLHIHSNRSYDNTNGPTIRQILDHANKLGLQGIAITDHNRLLKAGEFDSLARAYDLVLIPGIEITCDDGHIIALGLEEEPPEFRSIYDARRYLKGVDGLFIAAHPFDPIYGMNELLFEIEIDAIEINGRRHETINARARKVAQDLGLPQVGSSDAHRLEDMGTKRTLIEVDHEDVESILLALKQGNCKVI